MSEDNINNDVNPNFLQHYFKLRPFEFVGFITANLKTAYLKKNNNSKINEENKSFRLLCEDSLHQTFKVFVQALFKRSQFEILKRL